MSEEEKKNGIATAAQIRAAAENEAFEPPEELTLPKSGFKVVVRKPKPLAYLLCGGQLPQGIANKLAAASPGSEVEPMTPEESTTLSRRFLKVVCASIVKPKFSLDPKDDEVHPDFLPNEDQTFLFGYIGGQRTATGEPLEAFRERLAARPAPDRPDGGDVRPEAAQLPSGPVA